MELQIERPHFLAQRGAPFEQHASVIGMRHHRIGEDAPMLEDDFRRRPAGVVDALGHLEEEARDLGENITHQSFVSRKIEEDRGDGDLGLARDLGMARATETTAGEHANCAREEQRPALGPLQWTCPAPRGDSLRHRGQSY